MAHRTVEWPWRPINTVFCVPAATPWHPSAEFPMRTLRSSDLKALAGLLDTLTLVTPEQVPARLVAGAVGLIPGLLASYNELGPATTSVTAVYPDDADVSGQEEAFVRFIHQHPVIAAHAGARVHPADTISNHATPRELRRLDLYQEVYRPLGVADQIAISAAGPGQIMIGLAISRASWGFTERDHLILDMLHPHLALGPARAAQLAQLRKAHESLSRDAGENATALIVLTRKRRIAWITLPARRLLRDWFGYAGQTELPAQLSEPLSRQSVRPAPPVRFTRGDRTLTATLLAAAPGHAESLLALRQTIIPDPIRMAGFGLTLRERQVLIAATEGLPEATIARRLAITPTTVNKHLENIYRKLEVTGRQQAIDTVFS
jgi:DNA-binding CsgD family transcriptional regulator